MIALLDNVQILVISKKLVNKLQSVDFITSLWLGITLWITNEISNFVTCSNNLIQNSQAVKKVCGPQKGYGEKRCEIQGGGQEMAVMVG